jgi:hypothetical protein
MFSQLGPTSLVSMFDGGLAEFTLSYLEVLHQCAIDVSPKLFNFGCLVELQRQCKKAKTAQPWLVTW